MAEEIRQSDIPIEFRRNGARRVRPLGEVYRDFWKVHLAWLLPLDWYRYRIDGQEKTVFVTDVLQEAPRFTLYVLHRRGRLALTLEDLLESEPRLKYLTLPTFRTRMSRINTNLFGDLPEDRRPVEFITIYGRPGITAMPAYRITPGYDNILVFGTDPASGVPNDAVDWVTFMTPPKA